MNTSTKVSNNIIAENLSLENLPNEIWKPIKGYEGFYEISSLGRVKSLLRKMKSKNNSYAILKERILKQDNVKGYLRVTLSLNNKTKRITTHRLVAKSFIENKTKKTCVNHIDGDKKNNTLSNLEWVSYSENELHSYNFLDKINPIRKLKDKDVKYIRENHIKGVGGNIKYLADFFEVNVTTIYNVINFKHYV